MTTTDGRSRSLCSCGFPRGGPTPVALAGDSFSSSRPSNRACGSPAPGLPTPFTAGIRSFPPGLVRPGCDDDSRQADQSTSVRRLVGEHGQAEASSAFMSLPDEQRQTFGRVITDRVEAGGGVAVAKIGHPAAQEHVHVLHDRLDRQQQPGPGRELTKPVPRMPHRLVSGPAGQEGAPAGPPIPGIAPAGGEIPGNQTLGRPPPTARSGSWPPSAPGRVGQQLSKPRKRGLGLLPGTAHHHQVVGEADQHPVLARIPHPIEPVQVDVAEQRGLADPLVGSRSPTAGPARPPSPRRRARRAATSARTGHRPVPRPLVSTGLSGSP